MSNTHKVIQILDSKSLLVNYGRIHGAEKNDEIRVIDIGPEIIDPETGMVLGTFDNIKETLTLVTVYEKFSLCKKIKTTTSNTFLNPLSTFNTTTKTIGNINIDKSSINNVSKPNDNIIRVGDYIEII